LSQHRNVKLRDVASELNAGAGPLPAE
jgi:hypothetical protein